METFVLPLEYQQINAKSGEMIVNATQIIA